MSIDLILQQTIDVLDRQSFVLSSFEAHLSEGTFGTCLPSKTGRFVPVEQGKIVPKYLLTEGNGFGKLMGPGSVGMACYAR